MSPTAKPSSDRSSVLAVEVGTKVKCWSIRQALSHPDFVLEKESAPPTPVLEEKFMFRVPLLLSATVGLVEAVWKPKERFPLPPQRRWHRSSSKSKFWVVGRHGRGGGAVRYACWRSLGAGHMSPAGLLENSARIGPTEHGIRRELVVRPPENRV